MTTSHKKRGTSKALKKKTKRERAQKSKLEKILDLDLVESRDRVEQELAKVRPLPAHKVKRKSELLTVKKQPAKAPTPKAKADPLNPLNESRRQLRERAGGRRPMGAGPAGPGVERRAKELQPKDTKAKLLALLKKKQQTAA